MKRVPLYAPEVERAVDHAVVLHHEAQRVAVVLRNSLKQLQKCEQRSQRAVRQLRRYRGWR